MCKKLFFVLLVLGVILPTTARAISARQHSSDDTDLIGYWKLDESAGAKTADDSSQYTANMRARVWDPNDPNQFTFDSSEKKFGAGSAKWLIPHLSGTRTAQEANGVNARIRLKRPFEANSPMQSTQGSVAMWAKLASDSPRSNTSNRFLWGFRATTTTSNNRIQIYFLAKGNELCVGLGQDNQLDKYIKKMDTTNWHHYALTWERTGGSTLYDDGEYTVYVDGADQAGGLMTPTILPGHYRNLSNTHPDTGDIGNSGANGSQVREGWYGWIDEVGLYDSCISRERVCWLAGKDPNTAWNPVPDDNEGDPNLAKSPTTGHSYVAIDADLTWTAGKMGTAHMVYLGTDKTRVTNATTSYPEYKTKTTSASYTPDGMNPETVYYWRIDEELHSDALPATLQTGDVWKFRTAGASGNFSPDTNSVNVNADVLLTWSAAGSISAHRVFFGTDKTRVTNATTATSSYPEYKGVQTKTAMSYQAFKPFNTATSAILSAFKTKYYWRIDEMGEGATFTGPVWNFESSDYFTIDNFEAYATDNDVQAVWPKASGSGLNGLGGLAARDEVYPALPASPEMMRLSCNNTANPYYSGVIRTYTQPNIDYSFGSLIKTMSIWYKCDPNTTMLQMKLRDPNSTMAKATLSGSGLDTDSDWHQWIIILDDSGGDICDANSFNLAWVKSIEVGDGNQVRASGVNPTNLYVDELRLYKQRFLKSQTGDINIDGKANWLDIKAIEDKWLATPTNIASNPDFAGGVDGNGIPLGWGERYTMGATVFQHSDEGVAYTVSVDSTEGKPNKPAGRVILDEPQTNSAYGDLIKTIDVQSYNSGTLEVSFNYKGDLTIISESTPGPNPQPVNAFFEFRPFQTDSSSFPTSAEGGAYVMREQQLGKGYKAWDWKSYTWTIGDVVPISYDYLHLNFALTGRPDGNVDDHPRILLVDHLVVKEPGDTLPVADISEDTNVDFDDFVIVADNWLDFVPLCPPDCTQ